MDLVYGPPHHSPKPRFVLFIFFGFVISYLFAFALNPNPMNTIMKLSFSSDHIHFYGFSP